jgi:hypothetical protein
MTLIRVRGNKPPECPLCRKPMREVIVARRGTYFVCTREFCMISINKNDPCCGKWLEKWPENAPRCTLCGNPMVWFFRSSGYLKVQCRNPAHCFVQVDRGKVEELPVESRRGK